MTIKAQMQDNDHLWIATHLAKLNDSTFLKQKGQGERVILKFLGNIKWGLKWQARAAGFGVRGSVGPALSSIGVTWTNILYDLLLILLDLSIIIWAHLVHKPRGWEID